MTGEGSSPLFAPFDLKGVTIKNRIGVAPMCQYSCNGDGVATEWHLVHLGARAVGGAGIVFTEATAVAPEGRISADDLGLWSDDQVEPLHRVVDFVQEQGAVAAIQLAHAGRKASRTSGWKGGGFVSPADGGWDLLGPSELAYDRHGIAIPSAMTPSEIERVIEQFALSARRAKQAGFDVLELHAAHGYLFHSFLSQVSNDRTDDYGGDLAGRARLLLQTIEAVKCEWGDRPLAVRLSTVEAMDVVGAWTIEDSIALSSHLRDAGVDLIDCSAGGILPGAAIFQDSPGYQVEFAEAIRAGANISTAAVGGISDPHQAEKIVEAGQADLVLLARESLRNPSWPVRAALELGIEPPSPKQYFRAFPNRQW